MEFETFETDLLNDIKNKNKKCFKKINNNENLIKIHLGNENSKYIQSFVNKVNAIILEEKTHKRNLKFIKKILEHRLFDKVLERFRKSTVLVDACKLFRINVIKWLMKMNIDPCIKESKYGRTALMYAAEKYPLLFYVNHIMKNEMYSVCWNLEDNKGNTALFYSLRCKETFSLLYRKLDLNHVNKDGDSVILCCCKEKLEDSFYTLIPKYIINLNVINNEGKTPAMYIVKNELYNFLPYLERRKVNFSYINDKGESVLSYLVKGMYRPKKKPRIDYLYPYLKILKFLSDTDCNFNLPIDNEGNTILMFFIMTKDYVNLYRILKNCKGIDLKVKNKYGDSACTLAIKSNNPHLIRFLIREPTFDFDILDKNGNNVIAYAIINNFTTKMLNKTILSNNPELVNHINNKNQSLLIIASQCSNVSLVRHLLFNKADPNFQDNLGNTALYYAVDMQNKDMVKALMQYDADPNLQNRHGISPHDLALDIEDNEFLEFLDNTSSIKEKMFNINIHGKIYKKMKKVMNTITPTSSEVENTDEFDELTDMTLSKNDKYLNLNTFELDNNPRRYHPYMNLKLLEVMSIDMYDFNMDSDPDIFKIVHYRECSSSRKDEHVFKFSQVFLNLTVNAFQHAF